MLTKKKNVDMSNNKKYDVFISYSRKDYMLNDEIISIILYTSKAVP